jgi:hypothetical protein
MGTRSLAPRTFDRALSTLSTAQFVVVVHTRIDHEVYARAEKLGLCVDGFGELVAALEDDGDVAGHVGREHAYVTRLLPNHRVVRSVRRRGLSAYEVERSKLTVLHDCIGKPGAVGVSRGPFGQTLRFAALCGTGVHVRPLDAHRVLLPIAGRGSG